LCRNTPNKTPKGAKGSSIKAVERLPRFNCPNEAFSFRRQGKRCYLPYYLAPEEALENAEDMSVWANKAYGCGRRRLSERARRC